MLRLRGLALAAGGMIIALVLVGCGADGDDSGAESAAGDAAVDEEVQRETAPEAPADVDQQAADDGGGDAAPSGEAVAEAGEGAGGVPFQVPLTDRDIIYTGSVTVRVEDVDEAATQVAALATRFGGFVGADERQSSQDEEDPEPDRATMTLRIPSEQFTSAVSGLGELGEEESRTIQTQDVTAEVVDVETRIDTAEESVDRTRALLAQAESIEDIVFIERELSEREANLEALQARQRTLADLTTLSTITVALLGPEPEGASGEGENAFLDGLASGWEGFTSSLSVGLTVLGVLLPWVVVLGLPAYVIWRIRRSRGARPAPGPAPSPAATVVSPPTDPGTEAPVPVGTGASAGSAPASTGSSGDDPK